MIENRFLEGHEEKTFFSWKRLYETLSGPELRSWIRFLVIEIFHIFSIFTYLENGPNMQKSRKILSEILKKVDRRKQGKGPQDPSKTLLDPQIEWKSQFPNFFHFVIFRRILQADES